MIKCASVYTYELDDCDVALDEIKTQLDSQMSLLEHTVGIVMCHPEFIYTGTLKYLCEQLPFDTAGMTTASQSVNAETGKLMLTIFVITADDVQFKTGIAENLTEELNAPIKEAYEKAAAGISTPPELAIIFHPLLFEYPGDSYINAWQEFIPTTPLFGAGAVDDTISFDANETIYNGNSYKTAVPFILFYGNIHPRFLVGVLPEHTMPYKGEITKADGPFVHEINNINAYQYFENLGFATNGAPTDSFLFVPFMIDLRKRDDYDGIAVLRLLTAFTEDGTAVFRGNMDENSIFHMLECVPDDIITTTRQKVEEINQMSDIHGVFTLSCIIRRMVMGLNPLLESEVFKENMNPDIPFMMGYAGGEICPTSNKNGIPTNRYHNYSLITLII